MLSVNENVQTVDKWAKNSYTDHINVVTIRKYSYIQGMESNISLNGSKLIELIDASLSADYARVKRISSEIAQLCLEQGDELTAKQLRAFMRRKGVPLQTSGTQLSLPVDSVSRLPLMDEEPWPNKPVFLNPLSENIVGRFLQDNKNAEKLFAGGILTRFGLMLSGPPGTGKTLLAGHIAAQLGRPFFVARLDSLISSRLGETAKNIRQIFDFAPARGAVLFLDELDALAKMRDDKQELGELKRVVNTVIQGLDSLDDQAVVIAATNHSKLLDPAIWRRFPYRCDIVLPELETRTALWLHFLYSDDISMRGRASLLSRISGGFSGADIENVALAARRLAMLNTVELPEPQILWALAESRPPNIRSPELANLNRIQTRAVVKKFAHLKGVVKSDLADMLRASRTLVYRNL
jgi:hypothetical protein